MHHHNIQDSEQISWECKTGASDSLLGLGSLAFSLYVSSNFPLFYLSMFLSYLQSATRHIRLSQAPPGCRWSRSQHLGSSLRPSRACEFVGSGLLGQAAYLHVECGREYRCGRGSWGSSILQLPTDTCTLGKDTHANTGVYTYKGAYMSSWW